MGYHKIPVVERFGYQEKFQAGRRWKARRSTRGTRMLSFLVFFWFLLPLSFTYARSFRWGMGFDDESSDGARPACLVVKCISFFGFPPGSQRLRILIHD